jgi:hypothetical protein
MFIFRYIFLLILGKIFCRSLIFYMILLNDFGFIDSSLSINNSFFLKLSHQSFIFLILLFVLLRNYFSLINLFLLLMILLYLLHFILILHNFRLFLLLILFAVNFLLIFRYTLKLLNDFIVLLEFLILILLQIFF